MLIRLLDLPRLAKQILVLFVDVILCSISVWLAFLLRVGEFPFLLDVAFPPVVVGIALMIPIFIKFGLYRAVFRYADSLAFTVVARATVAYGFFYFSVFTVVGVQDIPRSIGVLQPLLLFAGIAGSRIVASKFLILEPESEVSDGIQSVLIYGAGKTGRSLAANLQRYRTVSIAGFVDDDPTLHGSLVSGVRIYKAAELSTLLKNRGAGTVLLAIPSLSRAKRLEIFDFFSKTSTAWTVRMVTGVAQLIQGEVALADFKSLEISDLIGRDPVAPDESLMLEKVKGRVVLVTGAGGSIGSELCRQLIRLGPAKLLLFDHSEYALYQICEELKLNHPTRSDDIVPLLGSVLFSSRLDEIMRVWRPATIYHAAAYKHVPIVEANVIEGIRNNVFGTLELLQSAVRAGALDFVLVSTDKAVRPKSVMGASKRLAEMLVSSLGASAGALCVSVVRFGNVLESSGSVVPIFKQQILAGGPITITHMDMTRYFMTIPEAAQLVVQAGAMGKGSEVFVLDMGKPIKIADLAKTMVMLSGKSVRDASNTTGEIELKVVGMRPGEKLHEELLIGRNPHPTAHPRIFKANEPIPTWSELSKALGVLRQEIELGDSDSVKKLVTATVQDFEPRAYSVGSTVL